MSTPFMQLYVADYLADTPHLTTEQHGAYLLLLFAMWRAGGDLDPDDTKLARIARLTVSRWNKIKGDLLALLTMENGRLTQKRLRAELKKAEEKTQKRIEAGRAGGTAKSLKGKKPVVANASDLLQHSSEPEPESEGKKEDIPSLRSEPVAKQRSKPSEKQEPDGFAEFYAAFPLKKARPAAAKAFAKAVKRATVPVLVQGAIRYAQERQHEDPNFTKHPATWLNNDCWLDEPVSQRQTGGRHGGQSTQQSFGSAISAAVRERSGEGLFDTGGPEIIDITPSRNPEGDHDEETLFGRPANAA